MFKERRLNIQTLRQQTEADHKSAEDALPLMHPDLDTAEYIHCLRKLYGVVAAWEEHAPLLAPDWLRALIGCRERKAFLDLDLAWFGSAPPPGRAPLPPLGGLPSLLGAMYVMEGSTLGGQIIARHVEIALPLTHGHGNAFFRGHGSLTGPLWKEFCEMLKIHVPDNQTDEVIASAKAMFATFTHWMQEKSVVDGR
jgi:heme oxygenase (biliverdin-IX-beta and delta-forming)